MDILAAIFNKGDRMPERLIAQNLEWMHVWLAAVTALWGGVVSYLRQVQLGRDHSWSSMFMHMLMSGFAGLMCWLGCVHFNVPGPLTAISTGLAGHMGAEFIKVIEGRFKAKLEGIQVDQETPHYRGVSDNK